MHSNKWNQNTEEGKKRLEALLQIVSRIEYREDLRSALKKEKKLKDMSIAATLGRLSREQEKNPESPLAKAWAKIPAMPHLAIRTIPDPARRKALAEDLADSGKNLDYIEKTYPEYGALTFSRQDSIRKHLGIKRPFSGWVARRGKKLPAPPVRQEPEKPWWARITEAQQQNFLADYRSDYREPGHTNDNLIERWTKITNEPVSKKSLPRAAHAFGETRNRVQIVAKIKTKAQVEKMLDEKMGELIRGGILTEANIEDFYKMMTAEFAQDLTSAQFAVTPEYFSRKIDRLIWTEGKTGTLTILREFLLKGMPIDKFHEFHRYIPLSTIEAKITEFTGTTNKRNAPPFVAASFVRGIGRLMGDHNIPEETLRGFCLPEITTGQPFEVPFRDRKNFRAGIINGPNLGVLHTPLIEENTTRQAFAFAECRGWEAMFITGIFDLDMAKAEGPVKGIRALYSGRNINIDVLDPGYQEEARRIITAIKENPLTTDILYETAKEALLNLLRGLWKIVLHDEKPEFSGKVYVVLGPKEFEIITSAAHAEILYSTLRKQEELEIFKVAAVTAAKLQQKRLNALEKDLREEQEILERDPNAETGETVRQEITRIEEEISQAREEMTGYNQRMTELVKEKARIRMTNVRPEEWQRFYDMALALVSVLIERAIPNSKVISLGTTYIKTGPEPKDKIKIVIPGDLGVRDARDSEYAKTYGGEALSMTMAETVIICHPYSVCFSETAREVDAKGKRAYAPRIYTAPACLDGKFLSDKTERIIRKSHPIGRLVNHPMFQGGLLEINSVDGMVTAEPVTMETLASYEKRSQRILKGGDKLADGYFWTMIATDQHYGGRAKEFLQERKTGKSLGMAEAVFHLMREAGYGDDDKLPPIHIFSVNDDPTQGHHFPAEKEPDRHEMPYHRFESELIALHDKLRLAKNPRKRVELQERMLSFSLRQVRVRGTDSYTRQMQDFIQRHIKGNIDMFSGILRRSENAGLILRPVSDFMGHLEVPFDTCDMGLINMGTGNHGLSTTEDNLSEGAIFAEVMKPYLMTRPHWHNKSELLDRYVVGPVFGNKFVAFGTLQAPGGYEYGFDLRNTPATNSVDWGNTVRAGARTDLRRANYSRIFEEKFAVKIFGDKHFLAALMTKWALHLMSPAGTHTDAYGERGFPPNNSGITFLGLPAEGPAAGPILIRTLFIQQLRDYIETNPRPFPWETFLPNPL